MKCTRFQKPNKKDGAEYGLYLTLEEKRKLHAAILAALQDAQLCVDPKPVLSYEQEQFLERVLAELEVPT